MMKRRNIFILLSFMALALLACSGNGKTSSSKLSSSSSSSTITSKTIPPHEHKYNFDSFVWDFAPHNFTAKAKLICEDDPTYTLLEDAETRMVRHNLPTCTEQGEYIYEARYQDRKSVIHVENRDA